MKKIIILKTGDLKKYQYPDYDDLIIPATGLKHDNFVVCDVLSGEKPPEPSAVKGVIVTGSSLMVTEEHDWKEEICSWLRQVAALNKPVLGICFGHQLLALALGGKVGDNEKGIELGTKFIRFSEAAEEDLLFREFPNQISVHESHVQSILLLPPGSLVLASNNHDTYQAVRFAGKVWGVQFHPEFDIDLMQKIITFKARQLRRDINEDKFIAQLKETKLSNTILKKFGDLFTDLA